MIRTRMELQKLEEFGLAPYAMKSADSKGRIYPEEEHPFRTDFQRDRDRILHSHAFRRLEYKTQVFLSYSGDHIRNRLTHTIEVAAIARTIARALAANEDLTEAIALAHDLGHTPFGHAGERAMAHLMAQYGGFDHNLQALRIVDLLEIKYPEYDGINLTWEVRSGLLKHRSEDVVLDGITLPPQASLEAQIADIADDLTYYGHDVDDGLDSGLITEEMMESLELWKRASILVRKFGVAPGTERFRAYAVRCIIDMMVGDLIRNSHLLIQQQNPQNVSEIEQCDHMMISFSQDFHTMTQELRSFLYEKLYFGPELNKLNALSLSRMQTLFQIFSKHPEFMGETIQQRIPIDGIHRAVADYIAGMTDNFAVTEYNIHHGGHESTELINEIPRPPVPHQET